MKTKEELLAYLAENSNLELPFNPTVWEKAVELTEDKERAFTTIVKTEQDGTKKTTKVPNGPLSPVSKYFQLMALPQYQVAYEPEEDEEYEGETFDWDNEEATSEKIDFVSEEEKQAVSGLIKTFFAGYSPADKQWVTERLADYYSNYSLNEGADKMLVVKAVADELEIMKLTQKRARGKYDAKEMDTIQKGYLGILDSLKALKKQRSKLDEQGSNKFTLFMDELEREGEFKPSAVNYRDDIDDMLEAFEESMRRTLHG